MNKDLKLDTVCIHGGEEDFHILGSVVPPVFHSTSYEYFGGDEELRYHRLHNLPNHKILNLRLAEMEGAESAIVTASGMAAISNALLTAVPPGGHLLAHRALYGTAFYFLNKEFKDAGREVTFVDFNDPSSYQSAAKSNTRAIYVESATNPLVEVIDHKTVAAWAEKKGFLSMIDNTFVTPFNFRPIKDAGYDIVLESCTKYLNGHSDLLAGMAAGPRPFMKEFASRLTHLGGTLDSHSCFLLNRGLKTFAVRMERHNSNGLYLAKFLTQQKRVRRVFYPGLEAHLSHGNANKHFKGFSGMVSFELDASETDTQKFLHSVKLSFVAVSLGGVESLMTLPAQTSHKWLSKAERQALGISETTVRFSIGIENPSDLCRDIEQALSKI